MNSGTYRISHTTTAPYHPQSNSQVERFNRVMAEYIRKMLAEATKNSMQWEEYINPLMFSYNTSLHDSIKMSPHMAMFGYDPRAPIFADLKDKLQEDIIIPGEDLFARQRIMRDLVRGNAYDNNQKAREKQLKQHESSHKTRWPEYKPGQNVFIRSHTQSKV